MEFSGDVDDFIGIHGVESASEGEILILGPDEVGLRRMHWILGHRLSTLQLVVQY